MSLLEKRGLKPLLSLEMPDKILEKNIETIKLEYTELKKYYTEIEIEKEKLCNLVSSAECTKLSHGEKKIIDKCNKNDVVLVKVSARDKLILTSEILNHIRFLKIFLELSLKNNIGFKIPKIYLPVEILENKINTYFLDYIERDPENIKFAKFHNFIDQSILKNIGRLIGLYAKTYNKLLIDFELYIDLNDNIPTLLDFGESININGSMYGSMYETSYTKSIYDGIIEIIGVGKLNIKSVDMSKEEYLEKSKHFHIKYLKYKQKYLELKNKF
jgi:hypothetical protein